MFVDILGITSTGLSNLSGLNMEKEQIPNEITDALSIIDTTHLDVVPSVADRRLTKSKMSFQEKLNADYRIGNREFYIDSFEMLLKRLTEDNCETIAAEIISWPTSKLGICTVLERIVSCGRRNLEKVEACVLLCHYLRELRQKHRRKMCTLKEYLHTSYRMYFSPRQESIVTNLFFVTALFQNKLLSEDQCVEVFNINLDYMEKNQKKKKKLRDSLRVYECGMSFLELCEERSPALDVLSQRIQSLKAGINELESSLSQATPPKCSKINIVENPVSIDQDVLNSFILEEMAGFETRFSAEIQTLIAKLQLYMRSQVIRSVVHLVKSVITTSSETSLYFYRVKLFLFDLVIGNVIHQDSIASILSEVLNWTTRQSQTLELPRRFVEFAAPLTHYNEFHNNRLLSEKALVRMIRRKSIDAFKAWRAFNGLSEPTDQVTCDSIPDIGVPAGGDDASPDKISKSVRKAQSRAAKKLRQALLPVVVSHNVALKLCKKGIQNRDGVIKYLQKQKNSRNNAPADNFENSPAKNLFDETGKLLLSKSQRKKRARKAKKKILPMETTSDVESDHSDTVLTVLTCESREEIQADTE